MTLSCTGLRVKGRARCQWWIPGSKKGRLVVLAWMLLLVPYLLSAGESAPTLSSLGQEFKVTDYPNRDSRGGMTLAMDGVGNFVVVWCVREGEDRFDIFGKRFDRDGKELPPPSKGQEGTKDNEFQINDYRSGNQRNPRLGMDREGNFVVVWDSAGQDGSGLGIFAKRYDAQGRELEPPPGFGGKGSGNEFQINRETRGNQELPSVSMTLSGAFVVAWQGRVFPKNQGGISSVLAQRHDRRGKRIGEEFRVSTSSVRVNAGIAVASAPDQHLLIAWADEFQQQHIWASRYDGRAEREKVPQALGQDDQVFRVSSYNGRHLTTPQGAVVEATGAFLIGFTSFQDKDGFGVFAKRYDSGGNEVPPTPKWVGAGVGNEFQVNSHDRNQQVFGGVASDGRRSVIVWASREQDGDHMGIFAKAYDAEGHEILPPPGLRGEGVGNEFQINTSTKGMQVFPRIAMNAKGNFIVAWFGEVEGKGMGVFARRFGLR